MSLGVQNKTMYLFMAPDFIYLFFLQVILDIFYLNDIYTREKEQKQPE